MTEVFHFTFVCYFLAQYLLTKIHQFTLVLTGVEKCNSKSEIETFIEGLTVQTNILVPRGLRVLLNENEKMVCELPKTHDHPKN